MRFTTLGLFITGVLIGSVLGVAMAGATQPEGANPPPADAIVGQPLPSGAGVLDQPDVALFSDTDANLLDVEQKILGTGKIGSVAGYNMNAVPVPPLAELQGYDAVLVWGGSNGWGSAVSTALGDVLADYVDAGGGVVVATFCLGSNLGSWILHGRFDDPTYHCMAPVTNQTNGQAFLGTVHQPAHPIMADVVTFDGGSSSYRVTTSLVTGAELIADWTDGRPLIAVKDLGFALRADLNFYPPSDTVRSDFWNSATDGDEIMANALVWVSQQATPVDASTWGQVKSVFR